MSQQEEDVDVSEFLPQAMGSNQDPDELPESTFMDKAKKFVVDYKWWLLGAAIIVVLLLLWFYSEGFATYALSIVPQSLALSQRPYSSGAYLRHSAEDSATNRGHYKAGFIDNTRL